jgi:hypothetical protein
MITDAQVRKLMKENTKTGRTGIAAIKSGMSRNTAAKYLNDGRLPSEMKEPRDWRTRPDPFQEHWAEIETRLQTDPALEARTLFEDLLERFPDKYEEGQLRTLQRRIKEWRGATGPNKEVFFPQIHRPGEAMQTDFTWASKLAVTIQGKPFPHMLCHPVLPYSNWEWVTVCHSESLSALKRGVQEALFRLGSAPVYHQTDNSTAATHDLTSGKRAFNEEYVNLVGHFGMKPRTIAIGKKEQNGDVESMHRGLKSRLKQYLIMRGSNDFENIAAYESWLWRMLAKTNRPRITKLGEELAVMRPVTMAKLPEFSEIDTRVSAWSTVSIKKNVYSVPSRLIGEKIRVRVYEGKIEVYYGGRVQLTTPRLLGRGGHKINYRHVIWSLVKKPGAFRLYRYREDLFPSLVFRRTYDALSDKLGENQADKEYVRILHLAASTVESDVEVALGLLLEAGMPVSFDGVKGMVTGGDTLASMDMDAPTVDLSIYDTLLQRQEGCV